MKKEETKEEKKKEYQKPKLTKYEKISVITGVSEL